MSIINDIVEILTPFKWVTDLTSGQNVVTVSYILPYYVDSKYKLIAFVKNLTPD
jgi:hypothetical protein